MLGEQALALIRDVFEQPRLLDNLPRIEKRVVAWEPGASPLTVEHSAVIVSEEALLAAIRPPLVPKCDLSGEAGWTVFAARPLPAPSIEYSFGSRTASTIPVRLNDNADPATCWIESLEDGWLFLIPAAARDAWLLAIGESPESLLASSTVAAAQIAECGAPSATFPACARIASPLCGADWLACGPAAMAFDPICGDGTAHAIREAILAAAVIRAVANGGAVGDLLSHYEARLTAAFRRHLMLCRNFYESGGTTPLWRSEVEAIDHGTHWCEARLSNTADFRYRLRGFELEAVR
jgi:hypothetical protein